MDSDPKRFIDILVELLKSSVLTQALITLVVLIAIVIMLVQDKPVPDQLWFLGTAVLTFYFGSKVGMIQGKEQEGLRLKNRRSDD